MGHLIKRGPFGFLNEVNNPDIGWGFTFVLQKVHFLMMDLSSVRMTSVIVSVGPYAKLICMKSYDRRGKENRSEMQAQSQARVHVGYRGHLLLKNS